MELKPRSMRRMAAHAWWAAALVIAVGCGRNPYNVAPVHGTVTYEDTPLAGCKVRFAPIAKGKDLYPGKPAFGRIQSDGNYRLTTLKPDDGAVVGEHWVTIMNVDDDLPDGVPEFGRLTLPQKESVAAGKDNEVHIRLTREIVRKYREDDT